MMFRSSASPLSAGQGRESPPGLVEEVVTIAIPGAVSIEHVHVVSHEVRHFEAQRAGLVRQFIVEVGAGPINDGHEVVAHPVDAQLPEIPERLAIVFDQAFVVAGAQLDVIVHGHAFDHRPDQAMVSDELPARIDIGHRPDFSSGYVVERGDDAASARLANLRQGHRIVRPEPTPSFLHGCLKGSCTRNGKMVRPIHQR